MERSRLTPGASATPMKRDRSSDRARPIPDNLCLVWLVHDKDEIKKSFPDAYNYLKNTFRTVKWYPEPNLFVNSLFEGDGKKFIVIASGEIGQNIVPATHDISELQSVFIFSRKKARHEQWAQAYQKVKGVFDNFDALCQAVVQSVKHHDPSASESTPVIPMPNSDVRSMNAPAGRSPRQRHHVDATLADQDQRQPRRGPPDQSIVSDTSNERRARYDAQRPPPVEIPREHDYESAALTNSMVFSTKKPSSKREILEESLIRTAEEHFRTSLLNTTTSRAPAVDSEKTNRSKDNLLQPIQEHGAETPVEPAPNNTITQEQLAMIRDAVQKSVEEALKQQLSLMESSPSAVSGTTSATPYPRIKSRQRPNGMSISREVKIVANSRKTRIDDAFRKQRNAVVANKQLRNAVQQWSSIASMTSLAEAIKRTGKNHLEYAWLLFCWICQNIKYKPYCNNNAAESVFRTKEGVCRGFASLYHECCSLLGIECHEISGFAKQSFLKPGESIVQSPHAWNSIVLDDKTYLVDPTWGAGGRDNNTSMDDFYFLTSPEEFIYTHYVNGYQLLDPEITREEFISLPVVSSLYSGLGMTLISPKQGLNETSENLFKITVQAPSKVELFAQLKVGDTEYPRSLHTLCQRDMNDRSIYNCLIAPPVDGLYEIIIFAKTSGEEMYRDAITMRLRVSNIAGAFMFPITYAAFTEHQCILIEPLGRLVYKDEEVLIHMIIPNANVIKIRNGDDHMVPDREEYRNGVLKKRMMVQGDLQVCGRWDDNADTISIICLFNMI